MTIQIDAPSAGVLLRDAGDPSTLTRVAEAVDDRHLGADGLSLGLALCRDWASKKRLVCDFAEQETRLLARVERVKLDVVERQANLVILGSVTVDESHAPGLILANFLSHVLPEAERQLGVKVATVEIDVVARLD